MASKNYLKLVPVEVSTIVAEEELESAYCWAARHELEIIRTSDLEIRLILCQPETSLSFYLRGQFDSYRAIPPAWEFMNENWTSNDKTEMPSSVPDGIFHSNGVICAHFNRMAYKSYYSKGPHADWGEITSWESAAPKNKVTALTLSDMLQCIRRDFNKSRGHMK